jgi:hypothetical protein
MNVSIQMVPPGEMRYQTVGDWQVKGNVLTITVAKSGDSRSDMLVAIHELVEAFVFLQHGGKESAVDAFDKNWKGEFYFDEAGDDPEAPYYNEHVLATIIERLIAHELPILWDYHEQNVEKADKAVRENRP